MQEDYKELMRLYLGQNFNESKKIIIPQEFDSFEECFNYSCLLQNTASEMIINDEKTVFMAETLLREAQKLNEHVLKACVVIDKLNNQWI